MNISNAITLRLAAEDYEQLTAEAHRRGMRSDALAEVYVRAGLARTSETEAARQRQAALKALDHLATLTADLPPIDAVAIARASRAQLEQRPIR